MLWKQSQNSCCIFRKDPKKRKKRLSKILGVNSRAVEYLPESNPQQVFLINCIYARRSTRRRHRRIRWHVGRRTVNRAAHARERLRTFFTGLLWYSLLLKVQCVPHVFRFDKAVSCCCYWSLNGYMASIFQFRRMR